MARSPSPDRHSHSHSHSHSEDRHRSDRHKSDRDRHSRSHRERSRSPRPSSSRSHRHDREPDRERHRSRSRSPSRRKDRSRSRSRDRSHRDRDRDDDRDRRHRSSRRRSRSRSSESGSESDGSRRHGSSRHRSGWRHGEESKEERRRRRDEKKARRDKRELKKKGLQQVEWGKHGILTEADIYTKTSEFHAWLIGEKMLNPETLSKPKEKEIFRDFMEDYNTGTLPHEKYYDLSSHDKRQAAIRNGETLEASDGTYDPNKDLEQVRRNFKRAPAESKSFLDEKALQELRKVQSERVEVERRKRLGMEVSQNLGVRREGL